MFDGPYVCSDHHLDARASAGVGLGVGDTGRDIQDGADGDRFFKRTRIEVQEARAGVREGCRTGKRQLEGLSKQIASEDHKMVTVSVLWLVDLSAVDGGLVHGLHVGGLVFGIFRIGIREGIGPHFVDECRFFCIGGLG